MRATILVFAGVAAVVGAIAGEPPERAPLPPPGYLESCLELIQQERYADARDRLLPVVGDHPDWARAHLYLGLTYHEEHRYEPASEQFRRVLELDPAYHSARIFLGWSLYYLGALDEARGLFESYLDVEPDYADAIFALGLIDFDGDDVAAARARFLRAIRLAQAQGSKPTEAKARARLADVLIRLDEWQEAREELERSVRLNPDNHETYFKLSRVLRRLGDAAGAERALRKQREILDRKHPPMPPAESTPE